MTVVELELVNLKARVDSLETMISRLMRNKRRAVAPSSEKLINQKQLLAWLEAEGLIRPPTTEEHRLAAEWDALATEEKQAVRWELDHLPPGPMASDIVIQNRL